MDDLFSETGKKINRRSNEILFEQDGDILTPYQLQVEKAHHHEYIRSRYVAFYHECMCMLYRDFYQ